MQRTNCNFWGAWLGLAKNRFYEKGETEKFENGIYLICIPLRFRNS